MDFESVADIKKTGGIFPTDNYYPGQQNVKLDIKGAENGFATFEQHAKVNSFEEMGLNMMGYDKVNVAQKLTLGILGNQLLVKAATDIFPSATLSVNGIRLFQYNQPSFKGTHSGSSPIPAFYERYKK